MNRTTIAAQSLVGLLSLTALTTWLAEASATPWTLAGLAGLKLAVVGLVFLELGRAWPGWAVAFAGVGGAIAGGSAWLTHTGG